MNDVWKYLEGRGAKHIFYKASSKVTLCGISLKSTDAEWQTDKPGLRIRPLCRRCLNIRR